MSRSNPWLRKNEETKPVIPGSEKELNWALEEISWILKSEKGWEDFRQGKWTEKGRDENSEFM